MVDTSSEWIVSRTGIRERRIASPEDTSSKLAHQAALRALEAAGLEAADLDLIICATVTPDMPFPATACLVQELLGVNAIPAFDLSAGCSGFGYAISVARGLLTSGQYHRALVIGVDLLSRITDYTDRSTCVLFGDGAGAVILGQVPAGYGVLSGDLGADGSGGDFLQMPQQYIQMTGTEVFKFAVRVMEESTKRVLDQAGLTTEQVQWVVPHQANIRIISAAAARLAISEERFFVNVDRYGNTSAASIGLALDELARSGRLCDGDYVVLVGFGAGLTWSALLVRWWSGGVA
jgi:3-oxoacyl-[acyl-carrier-protein] synthase-3